MPAKIIALVISIFLTVSLSCVKQDETPAQEPVPEDGQEAQVPEEPAEELPFSLLIDGLQVGPDLRAVAAEGLVSDIHFISTEISTGELSVLHPDGEAIVLGQWQADQAQFFHEFPYGENHMLLKVDESVYDILVVTGAPDPQTGTAGCENALMELNPDARWEFRETANDQMDATWVNHIADVVVDENGDTSLSFISERTSGIENKLTRSVILSLQCSGNVIHITDAVEQESDIRMVTTYDASSVYLPATIAEGLVWERHGTMEIFMPDETVSFSLTERLSCVGIEMISVEAGEFEAYKVEFSIDRFSPTDFYSNQGESWYVPGIGRVLSVGYTPESPRLELISYEGVAPVR